MDELSPFTDTSLNSAIDLIEQILDDSAKTVVRVAPLHLLTPVAITGTPVPNSPATGVLTIPLDTDFLRIHGIKLTEWDKEVSRAITVEDPKYKLQTNLVTRGGTVKPVVVLKSTIAGKTINCYSYVTSPALDYANYVPFTVAEACDDTIFDPIAWQCAGDVMAAISGSPAKEVPQLAYLKVKEFFNTQ